MQTTHFYKKSSKKIVMFPRLHLCLCVGLAITLGSMFVSMPSTHAGINTNEDKQLAHISIPVKLQPLLSAQASTAPTRDKNRPDTLISDNTLPDEPNWESVSTKDGDTLRTIFRQARISMPDYRAITQKNKHVFSALDKDQRLIFQFGEDRKLETLKYKKSLLESYTFTRSNNSFIRKDHIRKPNIRHVNQTVVMNGSLHHSLKASDPKLNTSNIRKQINLALRGHVSLTKAQKNDHLYLLLEEQHIDGIKLGYGNVLALQYDGKRKEYTSYRYKDRNGIVSYYSPKVEQRFKTARKPTRGYFLSSPVPGARISSHFSRSRLHPILKRHRPHKGTDYAARVGTPVLATADGRIKTAGYSKANGNYIVIQHGKYLTKYLHLHRKYVNRGEYVKRGQKIGSVGATGLARGAHLHYEFLVNGSHKNPLHISRYTPKSYKNVKVAVSTPGAIPRDERKRFFSQTRGIRLQFASAIRAKEQEVASTTSKPIQLAQLKQTPATSNN